MLGFFALLNSSSICFESLLSGSLITGFSVFSLSNLSSLDVAGLIVEGVFMNFSRRKGEIEGSSERANLVVLLDSSSSYGSLMEGGIMYRKHSNAFEYSFLC